MGTFAYIARDDAGERVTGTLTGASPEAVLNELENRRLAPVEVKAVAERRGSKRKVGTRKLAGAYRQMADLLRAGVPLLRTLRLLGRSKSAPRLAEVMAAIADDVAEGGALADAMAEHGDVFPSIQIAMVRAGERGGFLEQVLERMGTFLENQAELRGKVIGNLIYPVALLLVGVAVVTFALVFLVPKFEPFYARIDIPWPTAVLLALSRILTTSWMGVVIGLALAGAGIWWLRRQPRVQRAMAAFQLRIPRLGPLVRDLAVGRFARLLGTLLENGIPLLSAMQISRDAAGHVLLAEAIDEAIEAVRAGETLAKPLSESGMFAEDAIEVISVGEQANNLAAVLITLAENIEKRVDRMLSAFVRLMEPLLLLLLGGMVFFIFVALVVPMLKMSSAI